MTPKGRVDGGAQHGRMLIFIRRERIYDRRQFHLNKSGGLLRRPGFIFASDAVDDLPGLIEPFTSFVHNKYKSSFTTFQSNK